MAELFYLDGFSFDAKDAAQSVQIDGDDDLLTYLDTFCTASPVARSYSLAHEAVGTEELLLVNTSDDSI
ncbi:uncharacterized protein N7479_009014 [Penicillium vulpinum]|uniref:uncharacterized protein n=1 Tax=Penicillium vulpinum TaxID=29845 RepID=UPI002548F171|nr:uncharacterized protein N7479_009014 [Penicillium vulpinum]KAJ5950601.1 hypothetical protein N7479_009014 [Penicillium vulpinum]